MYSLCGTGSLLNGRWLEAGVGLSSEKNPCFYIPKLHCHLKANNYENISVLVGRCFFEIKEHIIRYLW